MFRAILIALMAMPATAMIDHAEYGQPVKTQKSEKKHKYKSKRRSHNNQLKCMADNIFFEAGNQKKKGKIAVANVTMNRVKDSRWPDDVCSVVYQRYQFSWTHLRRNHNAPKNDSYKQSMKIAKLALSGALKDVTEGARFYHADYVNPRWKLKRIKKIQTHIFYK